MNTENTPQDQWVEITRITIPEGVREHTADDIDSRAASMAKEGQLQSILLSKEGDQLILVYGNGRLASAKKLGWEKIRADIKEGLSESQKLMMTLAENEDREDASPFYTAMLQKQLMEKGNLTHEQLAAELGKAKALIDRYSMLTGVPKEVQKSCNALQLSLRQCLEIAKLTKVDDQLMVLDECANEDLSGKALETRVKQLLAAKTGGSVEKGSDPLSTLGSDANRDVSSFQFAWKKDASLQIKAQYSPEKPLDGYFEELRKALEEFLTKPRKQAKVQEELAKAA